MTNPEPAPPSDPLVNLDADTPATRRPPWLVLAGAALALALWALIHLASEIREGEVLSFDRTLMLAMRVPGHPAIPAGPAWLPSAMRDMTALGGGPVLTLVVAVSAIFLLLKRLYREAALVVVATISGGWAIAALKALFARGRPDFVDHLVAVSSASFPSGHAGNSAIVYLTLATLLFPVVREARLRLFLVVAALLLVGLIGVSRVYLGVHYPSDVLAGWIFGSLWALAWWAVEARLLPRPARPASAPTPARP